MVSSVQTKKALPPGHFSVELGGSADAAESVEALSLSYNAGDDCTECVDASP